MVDQKQTAGGSTANVTSSSCPGALFICFLALNMAAGEREDEGSYFSAAPRRGGGMP